MAETGNRFERIVFLSQDGVPLLTKDGDVGEAVLSEAEAALLTMGTELITLNHPHGMSFSMNEVLSTIRPTEA